MNILKLQCQDRPGIVASVSSFLHHNDLNIEESSQFHDPETGMFFMRVVFSGQFQGFKEQFSSLAARYEMSWDVYDPCKPVKTLILCSKEDHCLNDLLYRWRTNHLNIDIVGVVSNHKDAQSLVEERGVNYHHVGVSPETKTQSEAQLCEIIQDSGAELILLARYMQILSPELCAEHHGHIINIHHSFLPGFKGAKPYHQAYDRGVKIIGATAHFVTPDLDEGPIIEQQVSRVTHSYTPESLKLKGRDLECLTLAHATELFSQRRIFLNQNKTVIL